MAKKMTGSNKQITCEAVCNLRLEPTDLFMGNLMGEPETWLELNSLPSAVGLQLLYILEVAFIRVFLALEFLCRMEEQQ